MKIKITSCSDCLFWYNSRVGEVFTVFRVESDRYWTRQGNEYGYSNFVLMKDCEVYKENKC